MAHHVFTEDQNTMEWYIDGIPVAELKRRYEAHDALIAALGKAQEDINWMLNNRQFLNVHVFDYIDSALANAEVRNG